VKRLLVSLVIGAIVAVAVVLSPPAAAHAFLDRAVPAVGSVVHLPPTEVRLWFTQKLEPAFSSVRVLDRDGNRVDRGDARVDAAEATLLRQSLPALAPGAYRVIWRVLSVDSHVTEGDFTFEVAP
jgi:methionine-rich copper-binding protein CopC